jgi:hypothetical protein
MNFFEKQEFDRDKEERIAEKREDEWNEFKRKKGDPLVLKWDKIQEDDKAKEERGSISDFFGGLGGAVGETIRTNRESTSINPFDLFKMQQGAPLGGSFQYEPGNYVGIMDTYEPIGKSYQKSTFKPIEFEEYHYEPYVHESSQYQPKKYEPAVYEPIKWEPTEWTPSEYDELQYQKTDVAQEPYVSPIQDPTHYEQLPNELTPNNGDILYDNVGQTWADSPIFKPTGMSETLFGKQQSEQLVVQQLPQASPVTSTPQPIEVPQPIVRYRVPSQFNPNRNTPIRNDYQPNYTPSSRFIGL